MLFVTSNILLSSFLESGLSFHILYCSAKCFDIFTLPFVVHKKVDTLGSKDWIEPINTLDSGYDHSKELIKEFRAFEATLFVDIEQIGNIKANWSR